jgi:hypothetical protein
MGKVQEINNEIISELRKENERLRKALTVIQGLSSFVMLSESPEQIRKIEKYTTEILNK